jgi:predicted alpha-1,6-mannanase (GH76 family)
MGIESRKHSSKLYEPMNRKQFLRFGLAAGIGVFAALKPGLLEEGEYSFENDEPQHDYHSYALSSYEALKHYFEKDGVVFNSYREDKTPVKAENWPYSRTLAATVDMCRLDTANRSDLRQKVNDLALFQQEEHAAAPPYTDRSLLSKDEPTGIYYDDNTWVGLNLLRAYHMFPEEPLLDTAKLIFQRTIAGIDREQECTKGLIFWKFQGLGTKNKDRNAISTAPTGQLGVHLSQITGDEWYLNMSKKLYESVHTHLFDHKERLYSDHKTDSCEIDTRKFSYNQGSMIGLGVMLSKSTRNTSYLSQAEETARRSLEFYTVDILLDHPVEFHAIYFRNLLFLHGNTTDATLKKDILSSMQGYANYIWDHTRIDPDTALFRFPNHASTTLLQQASITQIYAMLATDPSDYSSLV